MAFWPEIDRCNGDMVRELYQYWDSKRGDRTMPARRDIDPAELKHLLPYLLIVDLEAEPFRVRYRLLGTKVVAESGNDFTGRYLDEMLAGDTEDEWETCYRLVWRDKRPIFGAATVPMLGGDPFDYEFGICPLGADGETVTQCVAIEDYRQLNNRLFELRNAAQPWRPRGLRPKTPGASG